MLVNSRDGKHYFISFVDDHSRYAVVYAIRAKSEVKDVLQHFLRSALLGYQCRFLHTDQGGEYKNDAVAKLLLEHGVTHETTSSHTPEHNGVAKRFNILDMLQCMLLNSGLPKNLWNEALITAVAINNRLPTTTLHRSPSGTPHSTNRSRTSTTLAPQYRSYCPTTNTQSLGPEQETAHTSGQRARTPHTTASW